MMKVFVYSFREFDEAGFFERFAQKYDIEIGYTNKPPAMDTAELAAGSDYISIVTTPVDRELVTKFHELGIRMISTRTIGYDHVDLEAARELGVQVSNVTYSPDSVADYTLMLMLMSIRNMKRIMERAQINDFSLKGLIGRQLAGFTVGVLGTGRIGQAVIHYLHGLGCRVYAYDLFPAESVRQYAEYADLETIYRECDMITLHMPLTDETEHLINADAIAAMRPGVVIINTARGGLIDTRALITGLEQGKIGAVGLDVIEDEFDMYYYDRKGDVMSKRDLFTLRGFPNAVITPHMAFYTDQAISDMVEHSLLSCYLTERGEENPWRRV